MTTQTAASSAQSAAPKRQLTLLDTTSIIVGIIIGSTFYESTPDIANAVPSAFWLIAVWVIGGLLSLIGALCYAELATAFPASGGDYVYLTRAFGRPLGFLFAWAQLWIIRPGSIGAMGYVFARYADQLVPLGIGAKGLMAYAVGSIVVLTLVNVIGVRQSKWTQNVLTALKAAGLIAILLIGVFYSPSKSAAAVTGSQLPFALALILIFYAYGGWNEMAYVAAEVRDPQKNILRSLILGTVAVTLIYVLANLAFLHTLGFSGMRESKAIAADVLRVAAGSWGGRLISALICITALGAINGMIFTGARISYAVGAEHRIFAWLGRWDSRTGTPIWSLVMQAIVTIALSVAFGMTGTGFRRFVDFTTPVFWVFFLLVGVSLFALRLREPGIARPYRVPLYPVIPALFCCSSGFMIYKSIEWAIQQSKAETIWTALVAMAIGAVLAVIDPKTKHQCLDLPAEQS